jgi:serine/threonine-protein kinase
MNDASASPQPDPEPAPGVPTEPDPSLAGQTLEAGSGSAETPWVGANTLEATPEAEAGAGAGADPLDDVERHEPPRVGEVFLGRYLVEKQIGQGGMGTVWLVRHVELDAPRALKLIVAGGAFDSQLRVRFRREARAMARLAHPNAVTVHDARIGRGSAFIEMEYVRGPSLNRVMTPGAPMPLDWVARIVEQLCDVLEEAHRQRIVHRDLKPSNMMLVGDRPAGKELLKVLDFGIAKILEGDTDPGDVRTATGHFLGSAPWTSPEQATGQAVDARSDLYSVGVILYEMLTGHRPFAGSLVRLVYDHMQTPPPRFAAVNPRVITPAAVEAVVLRCLAKSPGDRYGSARELCAAFLQAANPALASAPGAGPARPTAPADPARTAADFEMSAPNTLQGPYVPDAALEPTEPQFADVPATEAGTSVAAAGPARAVARWRDAPGRRHRRAWIAAVALMLAVAAGALVAWSRRSTVSAAVPEGYAAEGRGGDGQPLALVRTRDGTRFVRIAGGTFPMGNAGFDPDDAPDAEDRPAHPVVMSGFYLQECEATNAEMDAFFRAHQVDRAAQPARYRTARDRIDRAGRDPGSFPAVGISHELAADYARWVGGALPTEAQWEYAARSGGQNRRFVWKEDVPPDRRRANIDSLEADLDLTTGAVRSFPGDRTDQGVFDLTGNVREWCRDRWAKYRASTVSLRDPGESDGHATTASSPLDWAIRGGSFCTFKDQFRTTRPRRTEPDEHTGRQLGEDGTADDLGFRVVIEWPRKGAR